MQKPHGTSERFRNSHNTYKSTRNWLLRYNKDIDYIMNYPSVFTYCLLRYIHSQSAGEALNVGILFIFPEEKKVIFHAPNDLSRLSYTYKNFSDYLVKAHLEGITQKVNTINENWHLFGDDILQDQWAFISKELLLEDATALQFGDLRTGVIEETSADTVARAYYALYFSDYEATIAVSTQ